jgi:hypothetical protein
VEIVEPEKSTEDVQRHPVKLGGEKVEAQPKDEPESDSSTKSEEKS